MEARVTITVKVPEVGATDKQVIEWLKYFTGYTAELSLGNPLEGYDMYADDFEVEL